MTSKRTIVVLISGSGTNLQALIDATSTQLIPNTQISLVLSNRKAAYGLTRASLASPPIPTTTLALQTFLKSDPTKNLTRADYDREVGRIVLAQNPDLVVLAGWMHILGDPFLEQVSARSIPVINLHPALPGAFDGANAIQRAYDAFQKGEITGGGVMVHRVVRDVDRGEPVLVRNVEMLEGESIEAFEERLHKVEHEIIVEATRIVLDEVKLLSNS